MNIYYNSRSRNLRALTSEQRYNIKTILTNPHELATRHCKINYRVEHAGESLPIFGFRDGIGADRLTNRVLYIYWQQHCLILDYVLSHDYHKSQAMDKSYMLKYFATLKENGFAIEEEADSQETVAHKELSVAQNPGWVPVCFNHENHFFLPTERQQQLALGNKTYPMIIEGSAGTGKTVSLTLMYEILAEQARENQAALEKEEIFYLYPQSATRLGEQMEKNWQKSHLKGEQSDNHLIFKTSAVDSLLPEPLRSEALERLKSDLHQLFQSKAEIVHKTEVTPLATAWKLVLSSNISSDIMLEYLLIIAIFDAYLPAKRPALHEMLSGRGGIAKELLEAFETIYVKIKERAWFKPVLQALRHDPCFDMLIIDEAQNVSFIALAYLLFNTKNYKVVYSGDRDQTNDWNTLTSLKMISQLLSHCRITPHYELLEQHYRCPQQIWQYAKNTLLPFKNNLFGSEYRRSSSPEVTQEELKNTLSFLKAGPKNKALLQEIFENIEAMAADCFIVTHDIEKFNNFSKEYLGGKEFIVLTPEQVAGLEVKTVIAFDLIDWKKINDIEKNHSLQGSKIKTRLTNLEGDAQEGHEHLNHLYVALTRSTENAIIIESEDFSRYAAHQRLFGILPEPQARPGQAYMSATPEQLRAIYESLGDPQSKKAQDFYARNGDKFVHLLKPLPPQPQTKENGPSVTDVTTAAPAPVPYIGAENVEKILTFLGQKRDNRWENLEGLSCNLLAHVLFTPYGKRGSKKSFFERLKDDALKNTKGSKEQALWAKLLGSPAHSLILSDTFHSLTLPTGGQSIAQYLHDLDKTHYSVAQLVRQLKEPVATASESSIKSQAASALPSNKSAMKKSQNKIPKSPLQQKSAPICIMTGSNEDFASFIEESQGEINRLFEEMINLVVTGDFNQPDPENQNVNALMFRDLYTNLSLKYEIKKQFETRTLSLGNTSAAVTVFNDLVQKLTHMIETNADFWWGDLRGKFSFIKNVTRNDQIFFENNRLRKAAELIKQKIKTEQGNFTSAHAFSKITYFMVLMASYVQPSDKNHPKYQPMLLTLYEFDEELFKYLSVYGAGSRLVSLMLQDEFWKKQTPDEKIYHVTKYLNKLKDVDSNNARILIGLLMHVSTEHRSDHTEERPSQAPLLLGQKYDQQQTKPGFKK